MLVRLDVDHGSSFSQLQQEGMNSDVQFNVGGKLIQRSTLQMTTTDSDLKIKFGIDSCYLALHRCL